MSDPLSLPEGGDARSDPMQPRDGRSEASALPAPGEIAPLPWIALSKTDCVLWALALHRAAVAARSSAGVER